MIAHITLVAWLAESLLLPVPNSVLIVVALLSGY